MSAGIDFDQANAAQKLMRRFAASGPGSWLFVRVLHHIDRPVFRLTRGRHTVASLLSGIPVVMLTTTGAKSGRPRSVPLLGVPDGDTVAIIGSNFGQGHHPAWVHNLRSDPSAEITVNGVSQRVRAVEADDTRRAAIWQRGLQVYPGFDQYERRASHRRISVFVLEPAA
ncbi:MAG TPA: nitroreductase/quinone reductase family protein [Solirubrobacteraceae bacterium]|nr:nitroreductase/quinone reductase family protein [Solirubrobacteraceae bacterium]